METKYCSYSVLPPKGKRTTARRSCKKTQNASENSDLCEVLNKRCGLKENHNRRMNTTLRSKRTSPQKKTRTSQSKTVNATEVQSKRSAPKISTQNLIAEPTKVEYLPVGPPVRSADVEIMKKTFEDLKLKGESTTQASGDYERYLGDSNAENEKKYERTLQLYKEIENIFGSDLINIKSDRQMAGSAYFDHAKISVKPGMQESFNKKLSKFESGLGLSF
jgi:hypothetical protein